MGDERPALLGQQPEHPLFCRHQRIKPRRLAVEIVGDGALLRERWNRQPHRSYLGLRYPEARDAVRRQLKLHPDRLRLEAPE